VSASHFVVYRIGDPNVDLSFDDRDSAHAAPLGVVIDPAFTWGDHRPPRRPQHDTIIYEVHVKGFTKLHPDVPDELPACCEFLGKKTSEPKSLQTLADSSMVIFAIA
jgi:pullulanase/glycogen debranching enzyme